MRASASAFSRCYDARHDLDTYQKENTQPLVQSLHSKLYHDPAFEHPSLSLVILVSLFRALNTRSYPLSQLEKKSLFCWLRGHGDILNTHLSLPNPSIANELYMERNLRRLKLDFVKDGESSPPHEEPEGEVLEWDWDVEHADRKAEAKADAALHGALPFEVDRKVLKDVVREKMGAEVVRIKFLSAGTFHKAYLVTLADRQQVVARVARKFMPRLKTESEVATMQFLREHTAIPVPIVYHYDSNPYNRLGGEFIIMSKARGIPLAKVYHSLSYNDLVKLLTNLAELVIPLFAHRFPELGSLYFGPNPRANADASAPTPKAVQMHYSAFPFSPTLPMSPSPSAQSFRQHSSYAVPKISPQEFHVGPIISWPFFGSNRGDLAHPNEINRGPWSSTQSYLESCVQREIKGVIRENEGKAAPHKLHLDPDEILSSRRHHVKAVPGDESDDSDEWDLEESEEEWEGPGDVMYRDYRRMQRTTFLIAHTKEREECVRKEMARWLNLTERLMKHEREIREATQTQVSLPEEFGLDCHDLSLENVFVDEVEHHKITCIIDWESTTTRPLWACAHLPAFLQFSPFTGKIFRDIVAKMASTASTSSSSTPTTRQGFQLRYSQHFTPQEKASLAREWLQYESTGMRLRMAHRFIEWDGWEEGLADSMLGEEEHEDSWFADVAYDGSNLTSPPMTGNETITGSSMQNALVAAEIVGFTGPSRSSAGPGGGDGDKGAESILGSPLTRRKPISKLKKLPFATEFEKEQMLDTTGDICGGRGGELGRRLEAWLSVNGHEPNTSAPIDGPRRRWHNDDVDSGEAE